MSKGSSKAAQNQVGQDQGFTTAASNRFHQDYTNLFPFLEGEIKNPQGYGEDTVSQMLTKGGQSVSGTLGAQNEAADLYGSRTGNTAAIPALMADSSRNAFKQNSNNALDVMLNNANLKQKQQQAGAAGMGSLYGEDVGAALKSMGLTNDAIGEWTGAKKAANEGELGWYNGIMGTAEKGATMGLGA